MCECFPCMCVCMCTPRGWWCPWGPEKDVRFPETGITDGYELPCGIWELNSTLKTLLLLTVIKDISDKFQTISITKNANKCFLLRNNLDGKALSWTTESDISKMDTVFFILCSHSLPGNSLVHPSVSTWLVNPSKQYPDFFGHFTYSIIPFLCCYDWGPNVSSWHCFTF